VVHSRSTRSQLTATIGIDHNNHPRPRTPAASSSAVVECCQLWEVGGLENRQPFTRSVGGLPTVAGTAPPRLPLRARVPSPSPQSGNLVIRAALVHESVLAPALASVQDPDPSWRSRGLCHGRTEVEPSQPQVQDDVQNPELERVRARPQEPRDVTIWLSEEAIADWTPPKTGLRGGQRRCSNLAILTALAQRVVFRLPLRQTEGFLDSLLSLLGLDLEAPDHTTLSRRNQDVEVPPMTRAHDGSIHLVVDSTGLKILGSGEWNVRVYKASRRRRRGVKDASEGSSTRTAIESCNNA